MTPETTIWAQINDWAGLISIVLAVALAVFGVLHTQFGQIPLRDRIEKGHLDFLIDDYTQTRRASYFSAIKALLKKVTEWWGPNGSAESFKRCLQIAYIYPLIAILAAWVWGNAHTLGGLPLLPDQFDTFGRLWRAVALGALMAAAVKILPIYFSWRDRKLENLQRTLDQRGGFLAKAPRWSLAFAGAVAVVFAGVGVGAIAFAFTGAIAFAGAVAGAVVGVVTGAIAFAFSFAFTFAFTGAIAFAGAGNNVEFSIFFLFFTLLPLLNACADFVSLTATRFFLGKLNKDTTTWDELLWHVVLDIVVALACLTLLLTSTIGVLELWELALPNTLAFEWRVYFASVQAGEPGQATPLILMAVTTLIPTAAHVSFGLAAFLAAESKRWKQAVDMLKDIKANPNAHDPNKIIRLIRRGHLWSWCYTTGVLAPLFGGIFYLILWVIGIL